MIVVDLGCKSHENERSIEPLVERFHPQILYGFDPHPELQEGITSEGFTTVVCARRAAWIHDGNHRYHQNGSASHLDTDGDATVEVFDLAAWLRALPRVPTVLKLDIEGAEHTLLPHLRHRRADELLDLILVEWHGQPLKVDLACEVEPWP